MLGAFSSNCVQGSGFGSGLKPAKPGRFTYQLVREASRFASLNPWEKDPGKPELYTQFEEKPTPAWKRADIAYFSQTGWKPILHYAVASSRWAREGGFRVRSNHRSTLRGAM